uniref:Uncharacterized protein n=1 Tax=Acrobeloides nanus TaxID=290746 RepID=A0A914DD48_9BILA
MLPAASLSNLNKMERERGVLQTQRSIKIADNEIRLLKHKNLELKKQIELLEKQMAAILKIREEEHGAIMNAISRANSRTSEIIPKP